MRGYGQLTRAIALSTLREPVGFFFTLVFAPALVIILGLVFGNDPTADFGGIGYIDRTLPAFASVVLAIMGVMMLPQAQLVLAESGALTRFRVTPLRPTTWIASNLTVHAVLGYGGMLLALAVGVVGFGVALPAQTLLVLVACLLGLVAFLALGFVLSALYPSSGAATGIGNVLMIVLMLTSGAFVPLEAMPEGVRRAMDFSPISHFVELVRGLWSGLSWSELVTPTLVLVGMAIVCSVLGALLFRWEPKRR
jgi:ABC-2 type transport system permease protein